MIGCTRSVDGELRSCLPPIGTFQRLIPRRLFLEPEETGVVSYEKAGKPIWTTHPIEKPYLTYQIGSATPELAVEAALVVANDVSGMSKRS